MRQRRVDAVSLCGSRFMEEGPAPRRAVGAGGHSASMPPSKKRPHRNGDPRVVLVNTLFWKILVTRVNRKILRSNTAGMVGATARRGVVGRGGREGHLPAGRLVRCFH